MKIHMVNRDVYLVWHRQFRLCNFRGQKTYIPGLTGVICSLMIKMGMEEKPEKENTNG